MVAPRSKVASGHRARRTPRSATKCYPWTSWGPGWEAMRSPDKSRRSHPAPSPGKPRQRLEGRRPRPVDAPPLGGGGPEVSKSRLATPLCPQNATYRPTTKHPREGAWLALDGGAPGPLLTGRPAMGGEWRPRSRCGLVWKCDPPARGSCLSNRARGTCGENGILCPGPVAMATPGRGPRPCGPERHGAGHQEHRRNQAIAAPVGPVLALLGAVRGLDSGPR